MALGDCLAGDKHHHSEAGGRQDKRPRRSLLGSLAILVAVLPGVFVDKGFRMMACPSIDLAAVNGGTSGRDTAILLLMADPAPGSHPPLAKMAVAPSGGRTAPNLRHRRRRT